MRIMRSQKMFLSVLASTVLVYLAWTSFSKAEESPPMLSLPPREISFVCQISFEDTRQKYNEDSPVIYFITPTYPRREQFAELTRLGQTLMHVANLHWIVADDRRDCNLKLNSLLQQFGIPYTYLVSPMPNVYRKKHFVPRGVSNRRAALSWIKSNVKTGVLYFGDDDNTFDLRLFEEIRSTKKVSMFPVGLIGGFGISSPVLKEGKIIGFFDSWPADRSFPVDMAGFAVSVDFFLQHPNATMPYKAGHEEDRFLKSLDLKLEDIEPKANMCTEVLVWHTQTVKKPAHALKTPAHLGSSLKALLANLDSLGVVQQNNSTGQETYLIVNGKKQKLPQDEFNS